MKMLGNFLIALNSRVNLVKSIYISL